MNINLIADRSVASAPAGFAAAVRSAADLIQQSFTDSITLNIRYGWGTYNDQPDASLINFAGALGGAVSADFVSYSVLRAWLVAKPVLSQDEFALASLPANASVFPVNPMKWPRSRQRRREGPGGIFRVKALRSMARSALGPRRGRAPGFPRPFMKLPTPWAD